MINKNSFSGVCSYYGKEFEGRKTASGEIYRGNKFTAAHPTLPFGTIIQVENRKNNKKVVVRINDRGPFLKGRILDVSLAAAKDLDLVRSGTAEVVVIIIKMGNSENSDKQGL
jgi:rare lipoprotein A